MQHNFEQKTLFQLREIDPFTQRVLKLYLSQLQHILLIYIYIFIYKIKLNFDLTTVFQSAD